MKIFSPDSTIYVAGHRGMVGSAILRKLQADGYHNIVTRTHAELDLTDQHAVRDFFQTERIDHVILAAAKVGGIHANKTYPAEFIYQNLMVECNVIHQAFKVGIKRLLCLGSSCIYPKFAPQPMKEEHLLTGLLEPTNEPYAIAKIAGIKLCESYNRQYGTSYRSVMPTNLYGPNDNFHLENSHVIPALIRKFHLAKLVQRGDIEGIKKDAAIFGAIPQFLKETLGLGGDLSSSPVQLVRGKVPIVEVWGTGNARREFLHVDDMASACLYVMGLKQALFDPSSAQHPQSFVNIGTGRDLTIREAAEMVKEVVGFNGEITFNASQPDGTPQKLLDTTRLTELGWQPTYSFKDGLRDAYRWYRQQ
ncbi:MAG: GDP-L-fucose synthase [Desulfobulbaceae bacterium]|nr:GDP-L-fucose synthase [Desulfobulbaceae bacterium]